MLATTFRDIPVNNINEEVISLNKRKPRKIHADLIANESDTVNNIYTNKFTARLFDKSSKDLPTLIAHADANCQGKINLNYIASSFNNFTHGYAYYTKDSELAGFVIWSIQYAKYLDNNNQKCNLLLICTKKVKSGLGSRMLYDVEKFCIENSVYTIQLEPAGTSLIRYYKEHGYMIYSYNLETNDMTMVKRIKPHIIGRSGLNKTRRLTKKERQQKDKEDANREPNLGIL